jgi:hypothetical protein
MMGYANSKLRREKLQEVVMWESSAAQKQEAMAENTAKNVY